MIDDTIAAIATPLGRGGIGVIRVSGRDAAAIVRRVVRASDVRLLDAANVAVVADLFVDQDATVPLDRAVVTLFRQPRSYTGEDVVEIACHGSPVVLETLLATLFRHGARPATPGEFTMRAFLTGKMDLTQAEAVRDLVDAQTAYQARNAQRQLRGELSLRLAPIKERLLDLIVHLESTVEFVEDDILPDDRRTLARELAALRSTFDELCSSYALGRFVASGATLALVGAPNVGKSSIFNSLLKRERAIVTPIPGTTRDLVSEQLELGGIPFRVVDTAGLRATEDEVERIGVERTLSAIVDADVVLVVLDAVGSSEEELSDLRSRTEGLNRIVAINKVDLCPEPRILSAVRAWGVEPLLVSALSGENVDRLRDALVHSVTGRSQPERDGILVSNARHYSLLAQASEQTEVARHALEEGLSEEFALSGLHAVLRNVGEVTGETTVDDILHRIFSTFCIGK